MTNPAPKDSPAPDPRDRPSAEILQIRASIDELRASIAEDRARAEKDIASTEKRIAELDRQLETDRRNNEGHRGSLSRGLEDSFAASLKPLMAGYGIPLDDVLLRVRNDNSGPEFDILGLNGTTAVVGEVKLQVKRKDVSAFADDLRDFREHFPEHARPKVYGVVAGMTIDDDAAALARKRGFFILRMDGAVACPETPKDFRPQPY